VFRAESYEAMLAWYGDIQALTEKTGEERHRFVRGHGRHLSTQSTRSVSSFETEDEADRTPYSPSTALRDREPLSAVKEQQSPRPEPGGRFPSSVQLRQQDTPLGASPSSEETETDRDASSAAQVIILPEPAAPNGQPRAEKHASPGRGVEPSSSSALGVTLGDDQDDRSQDGELYSASPLLPPVSTALRQSPRSELPPRVVSAGGGIKSRFTEVLESSVALSLPQHPTEPPPPFSSHPPPATAPRARSPQKSDGAVEASLAEPDLAAPSKGSVDDLTASATQLLARKAAKKVVLAQEAAELDARDAPRPEGPKKLEVDGRGSPSVSRKNTDTSVSNFPIPGRFPRPFRS
jgi:hypothetical protein